MQQTPALAAPASIVQRDLAAFAYTGLPLHAAVTVPVAWGIAYALCLSVIQKGIPFMARLHRTTLAALVTASLTMAAHAKTPAQWQALTSTVQVSLPQAIAASTQAVPGKVLHIEIDDGDGAGTRYEAEVLTATGEEAEVWVNAATGQAGLHKNDGAAKRKDKQRAQDAKISIEQAITAATAHIAGKPVKAKLDSHFGTVTYEVDVLQADHTLMEVKINAADGKVISSKRD